MGAVPTKAAHRQAELIPALVHGAERAAAKGYAVDRTMAELFRKHREFGARDRHLFSDTVFSYFRWKGWTASLNDIPTQCVISSLLDTCELHPAIRILAESTALSRAALTCLGDATLEEKAAGAAKALHRDEPLPIESLLPPWTHAALYDAPSRFYPFVESCQARVPAWLRAPLSAPEPTVKERDRTQPVPERHAVMSHAFSVTGSFHLPTLRSETGVLFEVQDLSSQCVGLVCNPKPGEKWWDVCAGSGGKALHLANLMNNEGSILATDRRERVISELERRARLDHVTCIEDAVMDVTERAPAPHSFRGVVVDASCSSLGTWARSPDRRWRGDEKEVTQCAERQKHLLTQAAPTVQPNGTLVYAVCTMTTAETVDVIDAFLAEHPGFRLDPVPHPLTGEPTNGTIWIWPWDGPCNGMFIARMVAA